MRVAAFVISSPFPGVSVTAGLPAVDDVHAVDSVDPGVANLAPDLGAEHADLVGGPAQHPGQKPQRPILQAGFDVRPRPVAEVFQRRISRPRADGPFEAVLDHVLESGVGYVLAHGLEDLQLAVEDLVALQSHFVPDGDASVMGDAVVVAGELGRVFGLFEVAAWFETAHALRVQGGPVCDAAVKTPNVDQVELVVSKSPFGLDVVNLEADVRWYPRGLDGGQVGASYQR